MLDILGIVLNIFVCTDQALLAHSFRSSVKHNKLHVSSSPLETRAHSRTVSLRDRTLAQQSPESFFTSQCSPQQNLFLEHIPRPIRHAHLQVTHILLLLRHACRASRNRTAFAASHQTCKTQCSKSVFQETYKILCDFHYTRLRLNNQRKLRPVTGGVFSVTTNQSLTFFVFLAENDKFQGAQMALLFPRVSFHENYFVEWKHLTRSYGHSTKVIPVKVRHRKKQRYPRSMRPTILDKINKKYTKYVYG